MKPRFTQFVQWVIRDIEVLKQRSTPHSQFRQGALLCCKLAFNLGVVTTL